MMSYNDSEDFSNASSTNNGNMDFRHHLPQQGQVEGLTTVTTMAALTPPKRPRTAYNFFFRDERQKILDQLTPRQEQQRQQQQRQQQHQLCDSSQSIHISNSAANARHYSPSPTVSTAPPHGKIGFSALGKTVGRKWRSIDPATKAYYAQMANLDKMRYIEEKAAFKKQQRSLTLHNNRALSLVSLATTSPSVPSGAPPTTRAAMSTSLSSVSSSTTVWNQPPNPVEDNQTVWDRSLANMMHQLDEGSIDFLIAALK